MKVAPQYAIVRTDGSLFMCGSEPWAYHEYPGEARIHIQPDGTWHDVAGCSTCTALLLDVESRA